MKTMLAFLLTILPAAAETLYYTPQDSLVCCSNTRVTGFCDTCSPSKPIIRIDDWSGLTCPDNRVPTIRLFKDTKTVDLRCELR